MAHAMPFPEASSKCRRGVGMEHRDCDKVSSGKRRDQQMQPLPQNPGERNGAEQCRGPRCRNGLQKSPHLPVTQVSKQAFPKTLRFENCSVSVNKTMFPKHPRTHSERLGCFRWRLVPSTAGLMDGDQLFAEVMNSKSSTFCEPRSP